MILRFCLYGFLKNQKYFEPFLILAFMQNGMSFAAIGLLIAFREVCINIMEIPTGAIADLLGRRKAMIFSFISYIISMLVFGLVKEVCLFYVAMFFFSIGEAFRTGTHKAIIFEWLAHENRSDEKTEIYGQTRAWSKMGSAVSMPIAVAALFVFENRGFSSVFLLCTIPYFINIINFISYPSYLEGEKFTKVSIKTLFKTIFESIINCCKVSSMRRVMLESMGYEGCFKASKDYLQPILQAFALSTPVFLWMSDHQRTAALVGVVYFIIHILGSVASRSAGKFVNKTGGEAKASKILWSVNVMTFCLLGISIYYNATVLIVISFTIAAVSQNFWRPILISRCATLCNPKESATVLSIESQTKSLFVAITAPGLGWLIDYIAKENQDLQFLPIAALGLFISLIMLLWNDKKEVHNYSINE